MARGGLGASSRSSAPLTAHEVDSYKNGHDTEYGRIKVGDKVTNRYGRKGEPSVVSRIYRNGENGQYRLEFEAKGRNPSHVNGDLASGFQKWFPTSTEVE